MRCLIFLSLIVIAVLVAGLYGALHDQISYTVSSEYFTKFKYHQFGLLESPLPDRVKAGVIGVLATWWMGLPIGTMVGALGLRRRSPKLIYKSTLRAFTLVALVALLFGLAGLAYGWGFASEEISHYRAWFIPKDLSNAKHYLAVGHMHNASYLGGVVGLFVGILYQVLQKCEGHGSR